MTLRDIVEEREPELIIFGSGGGIIGCPRDYHYLVEKYPFLAKRLCLGRCDVCWGTSVPLYNDKAEDDNIPECGCSLEDLFLAGIQVLKNKEGCEYEENI